VEPGLLDVPKGQGRHSSMEPPALQVLMGHSLQLPWPVRLPNPGLHLHAQMKPAAHTMQAVRCAGSAHTACGMLRIHCK
jgi:hypothetical protein